MPKHSTPKGISDRQVHEVKTLLWNGKTQSRVSLLTGVSQSSVSRIVNGSIGADIPWPNGAKGPLPSKHKDADISWSDPTLEYFNLPAEMQERILILVNAHREQNDLPPIPVEAPEYITYMKASTHERAFENLSLSGARLAEDRRVSGLMTYWSEILSEQRLAQDNNELTNILTKTARPYKEATIPKNLPLKYSKLSWDYILLKVPKLPIVKQALLSDNPFFIEAICVVFHQLRDSRMSWSTESTEDAVINLMNRFSSDPILSAKIQKEHNA